MILKFEWRNEKMFNMNNFDTYNRPIQQVAEGERQRLIDRIPRNMRYIREANYKHINFKYF